MKLTPITNPVSLRRDTAVGTRIFAGTTMIHGDTGWRDISSLVGGEVEIMDGGFIHIRRIGAEVLYRLCNVKATVGYGSAARSIPSGFRPSSTQISTTMGIAQPGAAKWRVTPYQLAFTGATAGAMIADNAEEVIVRVFTGNSWPTSLPGTPT